VSPPDRERRATVVAATAFVVAAVGGAVFAVLYVLGGDVVGPGLTQWLGGSLAVAAGGIGVGLVTWAAALMPPGPHVEEREAPRPQPRRRREVLAEAAAEGRTVGRRSLLGRLLAAALGVTGLAVLFPLRSLGRSPFPERLVTGWLDGVRLVDETGAPVRRGDLDVGGVLTVFPEGRVDDADDQTVLLRVEPARLEARPGREAWTPDGHVAYSKVCTHAGCPVGLYQVQTQRLLCPCHQSAFDVLAGARPVFGPATRPLPQLPLGIDGDGFLVARGGFDRPVGSGFWTYPQHVRDRP
jgi:ubiquinol-cytochrome c reductase iron-sulfur subunit